MRHLRSHRENRRVRRLLEGPRWPRARALVADSWTLAAQVVALGLVCYGIALVYVPAALIIGGLAVVAAFELPRGASDKTNAPRSR